MSTHTGYLLIADITGYTQFLTSSEMDHANPILQSLLGVLLEQIGDPLNFWKTEGDAVLAYSTRQDFPSGETFLTICEAIYNAFTQRRQDIIANTTCPCQACANVGKLDLKSSPIMASSMRCNLVPPRTFPAPMSFWCTK